jgi:hypothetical protein
LPVLLICRPVFQTYSGKVSVCACWPPSSPGTTRRVTRVVRTPPGKSANPGGGPISEGNGKVPIIGPPGNPRLRALGCPPMIFVSIVSKSEMTSATPGSSTGWLRPAGRRIVLAEIVNMPEPPNRPVRVHSEISSSPGSGVSSSQGLWSSNGRVG